MADSSAMSWYTFAGIAVTLAILLAMLIAIRLEPALTGSIEGAHAMPVYRFSFIDDQGHVVSSEELEVNSLIDAMAKAHMLLKTRPHHPAIEVWLGNRCAYSARQDRSAA